MTTEPNDGHYFIANECGFEIERKGYQIFFRNRGLMPYHHLSWFLGVLTLIFFFFVVVMIYLPLSGQGDDKVPLFLTIGLVLFFITLVPTIIFIWKYYRIKNMKDGVSPARYIADLSRGVLTDQKGLALCSLTDMEMKIKNAWDTYLATDDGTIYENIVFKWGVFKKAYVFKTQHGYLAKEVIESLQMEFFQTVTGIETGEK